MLILAEFNPKERKTLTKKKKTLIEQTNNNKHHFHLELDCPFSTATWNVVKYLLHVLWNPSSLAIKKGLFKRQKLLSTFTEGAEACSISILDFSQPIDLFILKAGEHWNHYDYSSNCFSFLLIINHVSSQLQQNIHL